jgi:hypothetical protein
MKDKKSSMGAKECRTKTKEFPFSSSVSPVNRIIFIAQRNKQ